MPGSWPFNKRAFRTYLMAGPLLTYVIFVFFKLPEYAGGLALGLILLFFVSVVYLPLFAVVGMVAGVLAGYLHRPEEPGWLTAIVGVTIGCGTTLAMTYLSGFMFPTVKLPAYLPLVGAFAGALCALIQ